MSEVPKPPSFDRRAGKSYVASVLSGVIVTSTLGMYGYLLIYGNPVALDGVVLGRILGTLDTSFGIVLAYWLGTSASSHAKDEQINRLGSAKQEAVK